ncbi:DUF3500 domain-containing protein [Nocardioides deserti]|uniref:DUF3500 domain-containing protein n=1 Tax=Nocardioides deserti TaxID=1588644 RepID=A0ABR6U8R6_9ACTN|nr:DUF3500 domain-containing protein [Nocardioides deserti]MBC2960339.1 DUF3500 domain-containing protein [Nocardioides deserti]GGO71689.1 hypothetical protein GCM10012276_13250 [Nocardioides deserti]
MNTNTPRPSAATPARRRLACVASWALVAVLALSSCGTSDDATAASSASSATTSSATTTVADAATTAARSASTDATSTTQTIADTAAAADAFLATLSDEQREQVLHAYEDETKTTSWSNFPVTFVERAGVNLAELTEEQQAAALEVLEALLSEEGYATVAGIIGGDQYLADNSGSTEDSLGQYYIAFFGDPSDTEAWAVQFGGHHLGINATMDAAAGTLTFAPTHLGVQPAVYTNEDGEEVQPFDAIYTDAFAFYDSLTDDQLATLTSGEVSMCAPGDTCDFPTGSGLQGSDLTDEQQQLLLDLVANWAGLADAETTASALAVIEATLDDTYISWSGATSYDMSTGDGVSFSISGPGVYIAFQAQQGSAGADVDGVTTSGWGHVHTVYRDPSNDYAGSATQQAATGMNGTGGAPGAGGTPPAGDGPPSTMG